MRLSCDRINRIWAKSGETEFTTQAATYIEASHAHRFGLCFNFLEQRLGALVCEKHLPFLSRIHCDMHPGHPHDPPERYKLHTLARTILAQQTKQQCRRYS